MQTPGILVLFLPFYALMLSLTIAAVEKLAVNSPFILL